MAKVKQKILLVSGILVLCLLLMYVRFLMKSRNHIEKELDKIRAAGHPVNCVELGEWYKEVPDEENGAEVVLEAVEQMVIWQEKITPFDRRTTADMAELAKAYGYGDVKITENPPEFAEDWQVKNKNLIPLAGRRAELPKGNEEMSEQMKAVISDYIADNVKALEILHTTTKYSKSRYPIDLSDALNALMPYLGDIRKCVMILSLKAALDCENNRQDEAVEAFKASAAVSRTLKDEPTLISTLVKISLDHSIVRNLEYLLNHTRFNSEQLKAIEQTLKESIGQTNMKRALIGERCFGLSFFTAPPSKTGGTGGGAGIPVQMKVLRTVGLQNKDVIAYIDMMNRQIDAVEKTAAERREIFNRLESDIEDLPWYCISTKMGMPALGRHISRLYGNDALLQLGRTAAAIERYRSANDNKLPGVLTDLVPDFLEKVPIDPFDEKPIKYVRQEKGYILYSIGYDLVDNGGKEFDEKGRRIKDGSDITFVVEGGD